MNIKPKAKVKKVRKVFTYSELWAASNSLLEIGIREPVVSKWQFLSSIICTSFTFEAYLNHIGPQLLACWPELERLPPWAKFELLCENLNIKFFKGTGHRPLQTLVKLLEFRNTMAHGRSLELKPEPVLRHINENLDRYLGERPLSNWEALIKNEKFAKRAREDLHKVLTQIQDARPEPKEILFSFGVTHFFAEPVAP